MNLCWRISLNQECTSIGSCVPTLRVEVIVLPKSPPAPKKKGKLLPYRGKTIIGDNFQRILTLRGVKAPMTRLS